MQTPKLQDFPWNSSWKIDIWKTHRERNTILRTKLYTVKGPDHSADKGHSLIKHFCQREPWFKNKENGPAFGLKFIFNPTCLNPRKIKTGE